MSAKRRELAVLAVLSVMLCGMAGEMGDVFATIIFVCLTFGILLLLTALTNFGDDASRP
jgi:small basic protein